MEVPSRQRRLSAGQADEARRVGERLQAETAALIRSFPVAARTIAGMSEWLGVTRPVCQRLVRASRRRGDAFVALTYFPGVKGLHQIVEAARERGVEEAQIESTRAAVDRYAALIDEHGGSQKRLIAAVELTVQDAQTELPSADVPGPGVTGAPGRLEVRAEGRPPDGPADARELAFHGISAVVRRSFRTQFLLQIYRPQSQDSGGDPTKMDALSVMGMLGVERAAGALPICPMSRYAFGDSGALAPGAAAMPIASGHAPGDGPVTLLAPFCSRPLPRVVAKPGVGSTPVLVEPEGGESGSPFDVVLGMKVTGVTNPAALPSEAPVQICSIVSDGPSRNLVMVALLHKTLARNSVPTASTIALGRRGPVDLRPGNMPEDRWFDRLPERPVVEVLGQGGEAIAAASLPACDRLGELAAHLIHSQGWSPDEFVGFRVRESYPVWGAEYLINFVFEAEEA